MKKAFSLVELVVSMVILAIVFVGISAFYEQSLKNYRLNFFERLYKLENSLDTNAKSQRIQIDVKPLNQALILEEKFVKDGELELKSLGIKEQNLSVYFR